MTKRSRGISSHLYSPSEGWVEGKTAAERWLSQLRGSFVDPAAYETELAKEDRLLYKVTAVEPAVGDGQLNYALGVLMPGIVGQEYYLTKGHIHAWRPAAEVYLCLRGQGVMLMEDEATGECWHEKMRANEVVYVPGQTFHRTVNIGHEPLVYWGVFDARAGHDYGAIAERNFQQVVVQIDGKPVVMDRVDFLKRMARADV